MGGKLDFNQRNKAAKRLQGFYHLSISVMYLFIEVFCAIIFF